MNRTESNRTSRLPQWRHYDTEDAAAPAARSPVLRPADFAQPERKAPEAPKAPPHAPEMPRALPPEQNPPAVIAEQTVEAPATPAVSHEPPAPLLDLASVIAAIWSRRLIVGSLAVALGLVGAALLPRIPQTFTARAALYFDPREAGLADASQSSAPTPPEMVSALVDSQVQLLTSGNVLRRVAAAMKLEADPEFTNGRSDAAAVMASLRKALAITRETSTYVISLAATTRDPAKSEQLANQVVKSFLEEESKASVGLFDDTSTALTGRLTDLQTKVREAEEAVERYRAENDMAATEAGLISDQRLASLNGLLVTAQDRTIRAKARAEAASKLSFDDVVSGTGDESGGQQGSALVNLRQQYATQAAQLSSLQSQMGGRHPRLQSARSSLDSIAAEIRGELQRQASAASADYEQAKRAEDAISRELAAQKGLQATSSDKQVQLNELQRQAAAARDLYQSVLKRSGQNNEDRNLSRSNIRVISPAEAPVKADGPGKTVLLVAGLIGGFMGGAIIGAVIAIILSLLAHPQVRSRLPRRLTGRSAA